MPRRAARLGWVPVWLAAAAAGPAWADPPQVDYVVHCQGCHRADGRATPGSVPALAGVVGKLLRAPGGREFLVRVPGVAQAPLDDAELAALLEWVLARFGGPDVPADHPPYTAAEVGRLRRTPLVAVDAVRATLLEPAAPDR